MRKSREREESADIKRSSFCLDEEVVYCVRKEKEEKEEREGLLSNGIKKKTRRIEK